MQTGRGAARRLENLIRDTALAVRRVLRTPMFAVVTVATLAVGLGMFAVVYTIVGKVLLEPMPYRNPGDLYFVWRDYGSIQDRKRAALPGADIVELQKAGGVIESVVALQAFLGGVFSASEAEDPMEVSVVVTSPGLFEMLGVHAALGRVFAPDDAGPDRPFTMVLTHELWNRLGADPTIIGKEVRLNGRPHTVIGVLPQGFEFARSDSDGLPQRADAYANIRVNLTEASPNFADYSALIRARPGTPASAVAAAVGTVGRIVDAREFNGRGLQLYPVGLKADLIARVRPALLTLAAAGIVLALMLMVNLATVLLARAAQREREFAIARALGAGDDAVVRGTVLEGALFGLAGGAFGALAAIYATRVLVALAPLDLPRRETIVLDLGATTVVIGVGLLLGLCAAAGPALWAARSSLSLSLASSAARGGGHSRLRRGMILAQVALSLVLLDSGALVARSFARLLETDPGFRPTGVFTVRVRTPPAFVPDSEVVAFQDRIANALAGVPGVTRVSAAAALPLTATTTYAPTTLSIPDAPGNTGDAERDAVLTDVIGARPGYFEVMGMQLVAGETFEQSTEPAVDEAVVDTVFARRFFPGVNPVGMTFPLGRIVGVVRQARLYDLHQDGPPQVYFRISQRQFQRALFYVLATNRDPPTLLADLRSAVRQVDSRVAVGDARTMQDIVANALRQQRTGATLLGALAVGALLLAAMGIFGVVAGSVTRRHHELAVRLAVGAEQGRVLGLVVREAALLVAGGVLIGVPAVLAAGGFLRGALVGVSPADPVMLLGAALGLALVTLAAGYFAARRALAIDPAELLREA
jgi:putative ABC transport system permease protein